MDTLQLLEQKIGSLGPASVPSGGTFVSGLSATVVTTTTNVTVIAAPAAGNHLVITRVIAVNLTGAEQAHVVLANGTTNIAYMHVGDPAVAGQGEKDKSFNPGLTLSSATAFTVELAAALGDVWVYAEGYSIAD